MFEWILPHQIILLWTTISVITGAVIALMITEGKNYMYLLANIFLCGFVGVIFGGIFVGLSDALIWEAWSLLIPIFIGGIASYIMAVYFRDKIPKASIQVKPIALVIAIAMVIMLSFSTVITAIPPSNNRVLNTNYSDLMAYNVGDVNILTLPNNGKKVLSNELTSIDINPANILSPLNTGESNRLTINSYHTSIEFPHKISEVAHEGDYISFKLDFSVPDSSPTDWREPAWLVFCYAEGDDQMGLSEGDYILSEQFFKLPVQVPSGSGSIYTSSPCVYDADENPMWAMYGVDTADGYKLLPVTFATWGGNSFWKADYQYTFSNTPEGWKPPYDQQSWQIDASGQLTAKEEVYDWVEIKKGDSYPVYGKLYCPKGMSNLSDTWYLVVIAYDFAYSTTSNVAYHVMDFTVKPMSAPIVDISSSWWVEATAMGMLTLIGLVSLKYGKKLI